MTGELVEAYYRELTRRGHNVWPLTPDGADADTDPGDGFRSESLDTVAADVVGLRPDLYIETHTEAGPAGVFCIYPDWDGDTDADVRDRLGPDLARRVGRATGLGIRGTGVMSEKDTEVGSSGSRLGIFRATEPVKATTTRLIVEHGSHTDPANLAILQRPGTFEKIAVAAADAIEAFYGIDSLEETMQPITSPTIIFPTGIAMNTQYGFYKYWEANGGIPVFGYPITGEMQENGVACQYFERARLEYHGPNDIRRGLVGTELLEARRRLAEATSAK